MTVTTLAPTRSAGIAPGPPAPLVDVVVPVYNEEVDLEPSVRRLRAYLDARLPYPARITIADNASADDTWPIAQRLAREIPGVRAIHLDQKGRGRALRAAWLGSDAAVVAYTDVDLSTDLAALPALVAPLLSGHSGVAIGSRLAPGARVTRGPRRELISRCYNLLLRTILRARFRDAQCGFKAMRADVASVLVPQVEDQAWFFDTELLVVAERAGVRIHEVPVDWIDDPESRVDVTATALADLQGIWRLLRTRRTVSVPPHLPGGGGLRAHGERGDGRGLIDQAMRFAAIGVVSTLAYAGLYLLLRGVLSPQPANALALVITALGNTAANRRLTFGVRGRDSLIRDHAAGLVAFGVALLLTSVAIAGLQLLWPDPGRLVELVVLVAASALATICRFFLLRGWITRPRSRAQRPAPRPAPVRRTPAPVSIDLGRTLR